jgi:hypothetical protein
VNEYLNESGQYVQSSKLPQGCGFFKKRPQVLFQVCSSYSSHRYITDISLKGRVGILD